MAFESLDWYPDRDEPDPSHFDEHHVAFITMFGDENPANEVDVEVTGFWIHPDPSDGAPGAWQIERGIIHSNDPSLHGRDVTVLLDQDEQALRRAENALNVARAGLVS